MDQIWFITKSGLNNPIQFIPSPEQLGHLFTIHNWLVVEPNPLKNMTSSVGMMTFPIYGTIKHVPNHPPALNLSQVSIFTVSLSVSARKHLCRPDRGRCCWVAEVAEAATQAARAGQENFTPAEHFTPVPELSSDLENTTTRPRR